jgi:hypothetical protein
MGDTFAIWSEVREALSPAHPSDAGLVVGGVNEPGMSRPGRPNSQAAFELYFRTSSRVSTKALTARSRSAFVCAAETCVLIRALPCGTTGYEKLTT